MLSFKKSAVWIVIVTVMVVLAVCVGLLAKPKSKEIIPSGVREPYAEEIFVEQLLESNSLENGLAKFTVPPAIPEDYTLFIQVSGRMPMGDDFMSIHAFEKETASADWIAGKTYQEQLNDGGSSVGYQVDLNVALTSKTDETKRFDGAIRFMPTLYENTQGDPKTNNCTHETWMHQFNRPMIKQIGNDRFYAWVKMPAADYCGSTIFEVIEEFKLWGSKFDDVTKGDPIYKDVEKYRKELTNYTVAASDKAVSSKYTVELVMTKGVYNSGSILIPGGGIYENNYMGEYELQTIQSGKIIDRFSLKNQDPPGSNFETFDILVDDYNDDGNSDFTIGYWGSSNGMIYLLYSVDPNGKIYPLKREGGDQTYYVAGHDFSIKFEKVDPTTFTYEWYDNGIAKMIKETFKWQGDKFVAVKK